MSTHRNLLRPSYAIWPSSPSPVSANCTHSTTPCPWIRPLGAGFFRCTKAIAPFCEGTFMHTFLSWNDLPLLSYLVNSPLYSDLKSTLYLLMELSGRPSVKALPVNFKGFFFLVHSSPSLQNKPHHCCDHPLGDACFLDAFANFCTPVPRTTPCLCSW